MPVLDRIADQLKTDPKFTTSSDLLLAMECLAFCMQHMKDHGYVPKCVWLSDEQFEQYTALYPSPPEIPTFFGIPIKANKSA